MRFSVLFFFIIHSVALGATRDHYTVLGIPRDADANAVSAAFRKLAIKYHPDKNPGDVNAKEKFNEATMAFEILNDKEKRARYDRNVVNDNTPPPPRRPPPREWVRPMMPLGFTESFPGDYVVLSNISNLANGVWVVFGRARDGRVALLSSSNQWYTLASGQYENGVPYAGDVQQHGEVILSGVKGFSDGVWSVAGVTQDEKIVVTTKDNGQFILTPQQYSPAMHQVNGIRVADQVILKGIEGLADGLWSVHAISKDGRILVKTTEGKTRVLSSREYTQTTYSNGKVRRNQNVTLSGVPGFGDELWSVRGVGVDGTIVVRDRERKERVLSPHDYCLTGFGKVAD